MSIALLAIAFNDGGSGAGPQALNIRRNAALPVAVPQWQRGLTFTAADSLAAYALEDVLGRPVTILVRLGSLLPQVTSAQVRAVQPPLPPMSNPLAPSLPWLQGLMQAQINVLGDVAPQTVVFPPGGDSGFVAFTLSNTRLATCGVGVHYVRWHWQYRLGPFDPWRNFAVTEHTIYTVLRTPRPPWTQQPASAVNTQLPWTDALDYACRWAQGARTPHEAAQAITRAVFSLGNGVLAYDCAIGAAAYAFEVFLLSELIERLRGGLGRGPYVNCSDCAAIVATFANALGADLWQSRMGGPFTGAMGYFPVNPVRTIGAPSWSLPCGWWPGWTFHEVAWSGNCTADDTVFDACLQLDAYPPYRVPLTPSDLRFGRAGEWAYRDMIATPQGRALCEPVPSSRQRRPVV
jgi:hypothetical protein